jgi:(1->4)-alpha-D-glucan 1-alpha-D-glucosylmutase
VTAPASTYRVQLTPSFGFDDVRRASAFFERLGVGAVYTSPVLQARAESAHGYDVVDPTRVDERLGGERAFVAMARALGRRGIGVVVDVVPNHMAIGTENPWWRDVLAHGPASRFATWFDIDWHASGLRGKVLVPILGDPYGEVLESGGLRLVLDDGELAVAYYDHRLPIDPADHPRVLGTAWPQDDPSTRAVGAALARVSRIPPRSRTDAAAVARRAREARALRRTLASAMRAPDVRTRIDERLDQWSGEAGRPESFDALDALIGDQAWFLAHWRTALHEIDYRRFFDIPELVAVRAEQPEVFAATHGRLLRLAGRGLIDGFRVDHIDGLHDPQAYVDRLRERSAGRYLVVEKILGRDEHLPHTWPVDGTTGYDFLRDVIGVLLVAEGCARLDAAFRERAGAPAFAETAVASKQTVLRASFDSELQALTARLHVLAREDRNARDLTGPVLREALEAVTLRLDVYRTYVRNPEVHAQDRRRIGSAVDAAEAHLSEDGRVALAFVRRVLLLQDVERLPARVREARVAFVMRWQQATGPIMAKGIEDTALYRHPSLLAMNDVGVEPPDVAIDVPAFHRANEERGRYWPTAMLTTSTHDTKRGEDARARLAVLSEAPDRWVAGFDAWWSEAHRWAGENGPDVREAWTLAQAALSVWPVADADDGVVDRLVDFLRKAMREAKLRTDWLAPDEEHEAAVERFTREALAGSGDLRAFVERELPWVAWHGALTSLAQTVLKSTAPGVPDVYRGAELWDLTLVDPDNRRPFDLGERARILDDLLADAERLGAGRLAGQLLAAWQDGRVKLWTLARLLGLRRRRADVFGSGVYSPLTTGGEHADHLVAFVRGSGSDAVAVVVPRHTVALTPAPTPPVGASVWRNTSVALPGSATWRDVLTDAAVEGGDEVGVGDVLASFPAAVLEAA